jgi:ParB family transcriptional regulator, chromosome partitioning protein
MPPKRSPLGKNLNALLGQIQTIQTASREETLATSTDTLLRLPVEYLSRGRYQPRKEFPPESLQELADSIRAQGIIQPIIVRALSKDRYEIIAGERRWRAAQLAQMQEVPVVIRDISDEATLAIALIENIQRENLNPMDEANALYRLQKEFAMTHETIAKTVGKSRTVITNLLRLLQLELNVKKLVESQRLSVGHAKVLLALSGFTQTQLAEKIVAQNLSVRETERLVAELQKTKLPGSLRKTRSPDIRRLETKVSEQLGAKVMIQQHPKGHGKLIINYHSVDELEGILERF